MFALLLHTLRSFSRKERIIFFSALAIAVLSSPVLLFHFIDETTIAIPAYGGSYTEGLVGQLGFVNPILARPGTPDEDITSLVFASISEIADSVKHSNDMTSWDVRIKQGATWQDGTPITSDDVIFTIRTIQDKNTASPLETDWQNITASRVSEREISFQMPAPYAFFPALLARLRPVPKKIFAVIDPANIKISSYNLQPLGSGPYEFLNIQKRADGFITSYTITRAESFITIGQRPYIDTLTFKFFQNDQTLVHGFNFGEIDGFGTFDPLTPDSLRIKPIVRIVPTGKYYALFFNQESRATLKDAAVRQALALGTNRQDIINHILHGDAQPQYGPIPPAVLSSFNLNDQALAAAFDPDQAKSILTTDGWKQDPQTQAWTKQIGKTTDTLSFTIKTADTFPLRDIAQVIKQNWETIGVQTTIVPTDAATISDDVIKPRNYEILLFGNIVTKQPDVFSFWHSSQQFDPGLNFSLYQNTSVDKAITALRATDNQNSIATTLDTLENTIAKDLPAIFLVSPDYLYITTERTPGITVPFIALPVDRLATIASWYTETTRVLK
ncbi:MAG: peptide ABC transporter substrate-binding protein [Candidatus Paceibacterota bacterium]|jgi:peptide/nickel transport system substrate-binding protein